MKKNNIFNKKSIYVLLLLVICIFSILYFPHKSNILIQLSSQGPRQMMGYLLKTANGKLIVIDGGTIDDTEQLIEQIKQNGGKVDIWFLTHAHDDHVGAFTQIVKNTNIPIEKIYASVNELKWYEQYEPQRAEFTKVFLETLNLEKIKEKVVEPNINDTLKIDNIKIEILGIKRPEITENCGNEQSMIIKFNTNKTSLLILGDVGQKGSEELLKTQKEKLKSDIVQMSHHGQQGASKELYEAINPTICLWPTPTWLWNNDAGNRRRYRTLENF